MAGVNIRNKIDFAPGENHIAIRYPNKCYYVPEIFHMAPTDGKIIPLFISDINRSRSILEVYGSKGFEKYMNNFIMINNYPVKRVKITGKVIGESYKDYSEWGERNPKNYVLVALDDFSSDRMLIIEVKVKEALYLSAGLVFNGSYGKIIEAVGVVNELSNKRELLADYISIIGSNDELDLEIESWKEKLEFRNSILCRPWIYESPKLGQTPMTYSEPKLLRKDFNRKKFKEGLDIFDAEGAVSPSIFREDSILLRQHLESCQDVIDLTDPIEVDEALETNKEPEANEELEVNEVPEVIESEPEEIDDPLLPDSEIQILEVNQVHSLDNEAETPVQVFEEFQLTLEFIVWILNHGQSPFKLADIYNNSKIRHLLESLTNVKLLSRRLNSNEQYNIKHTKHEIFHTTRHLLHINYRLIGVSRNQDVNPHNLFQLADHLRYCLNVLKLHKINEDKTTVLNVESYMGIFKIHSNNLIGNVDYKLINAIVDWILTNEFNERKKWKYDSKVIEWSYIG